MTDNQSLTVKRNDLPVGHPDNPKHFSICGAKTRQDESNEVCTQRAGWGTSHAGSGRCKLHGGANLSGPRSGTWKSGRYAHVFKGELAQHFQMIQEDDTDPLDLLPELEVQRTLLSMYLDKLSGVALRDVSGNNGVSQVGDGGVGQLLSKVSSVSDPHAQFFPLTQEELDQLRLLTGDIVGTVTKIISARNQTALTKAEIVWMMSTIREGIEKFVPREKQGDFVKWLKARIPIGEKKGAQEE